MPGWQVRLPVWHPLSVGREYSELFSDSKFGGDAKALKAARARRDDLFADAKLPLSLGGRTKTTRNTTGMVGVVLGFDSRRQGLGAFKWIAQWQAKTRGKTTEQKKQQFGLSVYGFDFALAARPSTCERRKPDLASARSSARPPKLYGRRWKPACETESAFRPASFCCLDEAGTRKIPMAKKQPAFVAESVSLEVQTLRGKGVLTLRQTSAREWDVVGLRVGGESWSLFFEPKGPGIENLDEASDMAQCFNLSCQVRYNGVTLGSSAMRASSLEELRYALKNVKICARDTADV